MIKKRVFFALALVFVLPLISTPAYAQNYNYAAHQHLKRSLDFLVNGDYANAINSSNNALRLDPSFTLSYIIRARAYYEINEFDKAITDCSSAIRLDGGSITAYTIRGNAYKKKGDYTRAITDWETALRVDPNSAEARNNLELAIQHLTSAE